MSTRFARSIREAFPHERFAAIEIGPRRSRWSGDTVVVVAAVIGIVAVVLMAAAGWL
jgi:hypothetical protein